LFSGNEIKSCGFGAVFDKLSLLAATILLSSIAVYPDQLTLDVDALICAKRFAVDLFFIVPAESRDLVCKIAN